MFFQEGEKKQVILTLRLVNSESGLSTYFICKIGRELILSATSPAIGVVVPLRVVGLCLGGLCFL